MLKNLPVEVLEYIFQYLNVEDLMNACEAMGMDFNETFWSTICKREGLTKLEGVDDSWKNVIHRESNWRLGHFEKREYIVDCNDIPHPLSPRPCKISHEVHGENILLCDETTSTLEVFNVCGTPTLLTTMYDVDWFEAFGSKLLVCTKSAHTIYEIRQRQYHEIFRAKHKGIAINELYLSNEFFTFVSTTPGRITVADLVKRDQFHWTVLQYDNIYSLSISGAVLNMIYGGGINFYLNLGRYDLHKREPINNVVLSEGALQSIILQLELRTTSQLLVYKIFNASGNLPVYVRGANGELVKTFPDCNFLAVEGEYVIYFKSGNQNEMCIWTNKNPDDDSVKLELDGNLSRCSKRCISSSLLVLTFGNNCFKIIDFQKATFLNEIKFDVMEAYGEPIQILVTQYYFVLLKVIPKKQQKERKGRTKQAPSGNYQLGWIIYDFKAKVDSAALQ